MQQNLRVAYVAQEPVLDMDADVFTAASEGLGSVIAVRDLYLSGAEGLDLDAMQFGLVCMLVPGATPK